MWGYSPNLNRDSKELEKIKQEEEFCDSNLRSTIAVSGLHIQASDGEIGHVSDFIIDDETWAIRYLILDTTNWFGGKKVLISPKWIDHIDWNESTVYNNLSREEIKKAPEYTEETLLSRDYETQLHNYYRRYGYWSQEP
jgi:sporulation protein YlmC with PRC-barrel domain